MNYIQRAHDYQPAMKGTVSTILFVFLIAMVTTLWVTVFHQDTDNISERKTLDRLLRSLDSAQQRTENLTSTQNAKEDYVIKFKFPWLPKHNTLPNFFHRTTKDRSYYHHESKYVTGSVVFGDNPHAADVPLMDCVRRISVENYLSMSPIMSSKNRLAWESADEKNKKFGNKIKIHRGSYSFGVCEKVNVSCSYVIMLRNPLEQAVSNYQYCKNEIEDELCQGVNANKVSLRQWILFHGSELFNQLTFNSRVCDDSVNMNITIEDDIRLGNKNQPPCWLKQKVFMERFSKIEIIHAVNYIIKHLEQWFAVIGLHRETENSLKMFEMVYKLPFSKCYQMHEGAPKLKEEMSKNIAGSVSQRQSQFFDENDPYYLRDDVYVKQALAPDYRIYKEALRLFNIQKQLHTNTLHDSS